MQAMLNQPRVA